MLNSVMVVDDESSIRSAVEQWLSLSGFEVQLFSRADECLAQLPAHFPGVILSDVRMPGMTGLDLLAEVQRRDADLPVILLTGHGDVPMAVEAMRDGAYDFLEKPFSPETLLGSLRRALENAGWFWKTAPCTSRPTTAPNSTPRCSAYPEVCRRCAGKCWTWRRCRSTC